MKEIPRYGFAGNLAYALWFWSNSQAVVSDDNFSGNSINIGIGNSGLDLAAKNNGWGTTAPAEIAALIVGGRDGTRLGIGSFAPSAADPSASIPPEEGARS
ncbi:MAG: hypothetical protein MUO35_13655 [Anaerolineales bacterium]|nr:hypothetical protein [Anaerolineales bacterium]